MLLLILGLGLMFLVWFFVALAKDQTQSLVVVHFFPIWMKRGGHEREQPEIPTQRKAA